MLWKGQWWVDCHWWKTLSCLVLGTTQSFPKRHPPLHLDTVATTGPLYFSTHNGFGGFGLHCSGKVRPKQEEGHPLAGHECCWGRHPTSYRYKPSTMALGYHLPHQAAQKEPMLGKQSSLPLFFFPGELDTTHSGEQLPSPRITLTLFTLTILSFMSSVNGCSAFKNFLITFPQYLWLNTNLAFKFPRQTYLSILYIFLIALSLKNPIYLLV